jgi:hypothetical protein
VTLEEEGFGSGSRLQEFGALPSHFSWSSYRRNVIRRGTCGKAMARYLGQGKCLGAQARSCFTQPMSLLVAGSRLSRLCTGPVQPFP